MKSAKITILLVKKEGILTIVPHLKKSQENQHKVFPRGEEPFLVLNIYE